jgi:two-component system, LytTR family, response regulator
MQTILITLDFLKKPIKSLPYLLVILCFSVLSVCAINFEIWQRLANTSFAKLLLIFIIPETITMLIILALIHTYHALFKIKYLALQLKSILYYELKIMPVFLAAYFFFYPFTFSVRYIIRHGIDNMFEQYLSDLSATVTIDSYFIYLPSVLILGYLLVNVSLFKDYIHQSTAYTATKTNALNNTEGEASTQIVYYTSEATAYPSLLKVRGGGGDTYLKTEDCIYFEASDHSSLVYHSEGIFKISMSIVKLEKELDPNYFFKNNPKYIINLAYLDSYIYTEKGQYTLNLKKPMEGVSLNTTKLRIDELQTAFQKYKKIAIN